MVRTNIVLIDVCVLRFDQTLKPLFAKTVQKPH
jgi:hypothetical protein